MHTTFLSSSIQIPHFSLFCRSRRRIFRCMVFQLLSSLHRYYRDPIQYRNQALFGLCENQAYMLTNHQHIQRAVYNIQNILIKVGLLKNKKIRKKIQRTIYITWLNFSEKIFLQKSRNDSVASDGQKGVMGIM